jgi:hypothetical protein
MTTTSRRVEQVSALNIEDQSRSTSSQRSYKRGYGAKYLRALFKKACHIKERVKKVREECRNIIV